MNDSRTKFEMVDDQDLDRLLNHTALRDMQIRAFWEGLAHTKLLKHERINIVCERFQTGYKNVERMVNDLK